jgi:hypothetical protein
VDVLQALVDAPLRQADREGCDRDATVVQDLQEVGETLAAFTEQVLFGDAAIVVREFVRIRVPPTHLAVTRADLVARRPVGYDDRGDLLAPVHLAGDGRDSHEGRDRSAGVGDEGFRTVDHPIATVQARGRSRCAGIRSPTGFGQAETGESFTRGELREPSLLLVLVAEAVHRHRTETDRCLQRDRQR